MPGGCVIGADLGGTKLLAGVVDPALHVHHRALRRARGADEAAVLDTVVSAVEEVRDAYEGEILGVGFGIPSLVDQTRGTAVSTVHLPLAGVPFRDVMAERLGLPVWVDNDANAALLAETRAGAAAGARHAVMLTIGTGIGGAVLADGRLLHGARGGAGELGHMVVDLDGPQCPCGNVGCLEALVSGSAIGREALRVARDVPGSALGRALASGREITGMLCTELAHDGDAAARDVLALMGTRLGVGVANLVNAFNPEVVVIGGGVIAAGDMMLEPVRQVVRERALAPSRDDVRVLPSRFGEESGMLGAALLALDGLDRRSAAAA
jgi:glucokinase